MGYKSTGLVVNLDGIAFALYDVGITDDNTTIIFLRRDGKNLFSIFVRNGHSCACGAGAGVDGQNALVFRGC